MPGGRPPKPTEQKREQGTLRGHRERDKAPEPPPMAVAPPPPPMFSDRARVLWDHYAKILIGRKLLAEDGGDLLALEMLCREWERYIDLHEQIHGPEGEGVSIDTMTGPRRNPKCMELNAAERNAFRLMADFGLTPVSRVKARSAAAPVQRVEDPFGEFRVIPGGKAK